MILIFTGGPHKVGELVFVRNTSYPETIDSLKSLVEEREAVFGNNVAISTYAIGEGWNVTKFACVTSSFRGF